MSTDLETLRVPGERGEGWGFLHLPGVKNGASGEGGVVPWARTAWELGVGSLWEWRSRGVRKFWPNSGRILPLACFRVACELGMALTCTKCRRKHHR